MGPMTKSGSRYRLIAASISSATVPWVFRKVRNGPTIASNRPRGLKMET